MSEAQDTGAHAPDQHESGREAGQADPSPGWEEQPDEQPAPAAPAAAGGTEQEPEAEAERRGFPAGQVAVGGMSLLSLVGAALWQAVGVVGVVAGGVVAAGGAALYAGRRLGWTGSRSGSRAGGRVGGGSGRLGGGRSGGRSMGGLLGGGRAGGSGRRGGGLLGGGKNGGGGRAGGQGKGRALGGLLGGRSGRSGGGRGGFSLGKPGRGRAGAGRIGGGRSGGGRSGGGRSGGGRAGGRAGGGKGGGGPVRKAGRVTAGRVAGAVRSSAAGQRAAKSARSAAAAGRAARTRAAAGAGAAGRVARAAVRRADALTGGRASRAARAARRHGKRAGRWIDRVTGGRLRRWMRKYGRTAAASTGAGFGLVAAVTAPWWLVLGAITVAGAGAAAVWQRRDARARRQAADRVRAAEQAHCHTCLAELGEDRHGYAGDDGRQLWQCGDCWGMRRRATGGHASAGAAFDSTDARAGRPVGPPVRDHKARTYHRSTTTRRFAMEAGFPLAVAAAEVNTAAAGYAPEDMWVIGTDLRQLPDVFAAVGLALRTYAQRLEGGYPINPQVVEQLGQLYVGLGNLAAAAQEIEPLFRMLHVDDLRREEAPRTNEQAWNV